MRHRLPILILFLGILNCAFLRAETPDPQQTRADFLKILDRPKVELSPVVTNLPSVGDLVHEHFTFNSESGQTVPGILLKKAGDGRRPVVIALHGTGGNKEGNLGLLKELAGKGFVAVAIDGRYHGERCTKGSGTNEYNDAITEAFKTKHGHPWLYDTVYDEMRLIDYLQTRDDVDAKRIGMIGFSKGGMECYLTAAADPRVAVAIPCIGVQSFRWALENNSWKGRAGTIQRGVNGAAQSAGVPLDADFLRKFYDIVVPGIYDEFDGPRMMTLIAPRPLMIINGDSDDKTPVTGLKECHTAAEQAYNAMNAIDKLSLRIQEKTGHAVNKESHTAAIEWFVKWLQP